MTTNYYFFTDANQQASNPSNYIKIQASTDAYGPVTTGAAPGMDEYRVTSLHTATFNPTAYAACDATVCVQRVNATLVNIILKPRAQPALNFAPIKYVIYKGILASSLINGTETAAAANNDLTNVIWETQAKKNASAGTSLNPPAEALGIGMTAASSPDFVDTEPIDNLFYRTGLSFQPPPVVGGTSLGLFDKTAFGIEVLMEGLNFHHSVSLARKLENKISVPALTGTESLAQQFDHWHAKEQVLGFMDPCAFYGSFFLAGLQATTGGTTAFGDKRGNALYHDVLFAFFNLNIAYLDIRNEHNFSLNYFMNYDKSIQLTYDPANAIPAPVDYYASKWPLLTLSASSFPTTNTDEAGNAFRIQLPVGDNPEPLLYVSQGYRDINKKSKAFPAELKSSEQFYDAFEAPVGAFTATKNKSGLTSMTFVVPNVTGQAATTPVSCYIRLKYLKQQQAATAASTVIQSANYLDNLVYPLDLRVLPDGSASIKSSFYEEDIYVNAKHVAGLGFDFIGTMGIARDANNTSFWVLPTKVRTNEGQASALVTLSGEVCDLPDSYPSVIASKYPLERVRKSERALSAANRAPVAEFVSDAGPASLSKFGTPDFRKILAFMVANATYDSWKTKMSVATAALDNGFRAYLGIKNLQAQPDTVGLSYTSFDLVLRGLALDASTGGYKVQEMNTDPANSAGNVTVYASAPGEVTCSITSDADGMSTACVPVGGLIQLKAVPSSGSGTYQWSTTSTKLMLNNSAAQTVTVMAKSQVSANRGAETVQLVFTPTGGTALPPVTRNVTVIKVEFSESANQCYGYDDMDNGVGVPHHVSVKRLGFTTVQVAILGGGSSDDLDFISDDATIAEAVAPSAGAGASFELTIAGRDRTKAETAIKSVCKGGPVCAIIAVNVYREVVMTATVTRIEDGTVALTALRPNFDVAAAEALLNSVFRSAVAKIVLLDATTTGAMNVHYDLDGGGGLTFEPVVPSLELTAIDGVVTGTGQQVVIVKKLENIYRLATAGVAGDSTLTFKASYATYLDYIEFNSAYDLGSSAGFESVQFTGRDLTSSNVFKLLSVLTGAHPVTDGIRFPLAARSGHRALVYERATDDLTSWAMGHELGHQLGLADLDAPSSLMNFEASWTDHKLRFKAQPRHRGGGTQSQWEAFTR